MLCQVNDKLGTWRAALTTTGLDTDNWDWAIHTEDFPLDPEHQSPGADASHGRALCSVFALQE